MENYSKKQVIQIPTGETIQYSVCGEGSENLVMIHALWVNLDSFAPLIPLLLSRFRITCLDLRGHGGSSYNKKVEHIDDLVNDIHHVMTGLGYTTGEKFLMLGISLGTMISFRYAALHPEHVKGLILISPLGLNGFPIFRKDNNNNSSSSKQHELIKSKEELLTTPLIQSLYRFQKEKNIDAICDSFSMFSFSTFKKPSREKLENLGKGNYDVRNFEDFRWIMGFYNFTQNNSFFVEGDGSASRVKCKVLVLTGELDLLVPKSVFKDYKFFLEDRFILKVYPEVGHLFMELDEEKVVSDVFTVFC